ncbi:hypothetical protein HDU96_009923 [Phlyctochytrium bullatum]|nr:hypothetical protein HDU96_009923 [Phlyctochytrium bullatum]
MVGCNYNRQLLGKYFRGPSMDGLGAIEDVPDFRALTPRIPSIQSWYPPALLRLIETCSSNAAAVDAMEENDAILYYDQQWQREDHHGWYYDDLPEAERPLETFKIDELPSLRLSNEAPKVVKFPDVSQQTRAASLSRFSRSLGAVSPEPCDRAESPVACVQIDPETGVIRRANMAARLLGFVVDKPFSVAEKSFATISDSLACLTSIRDALVEANLYGPGAFPRQVAFKTESSCPISVARIGPSGISADVEARLAVPEDEQSDTSESAPGMDGAVDQVLKSLKVTVGDGRELTLAFTRNGPSKRFCVIDLHIPWDLDALVVATIIESENTTPFDRKDYSFKSFLLDSIQQAIIVTDMAFNVTYFNRWAAVLYGLQPENIGNLIPLVSKVTEEVSTKIMSQLQQGKCWMGTFLTKNRDGLYFPAQVTDCPIRDEKGNLIGIVGISSDNTPYENALKNLINLRNNLENIVQQRTAELLEANGKLEVELVQRRKLQEDLELFSLVVRKTNTMVAVLNPELNVKWANESFYRSTSYTADNIVGKALFGLAIEGQSYRGGTPKTLSQELIEINHNQTYGVVAPVKTSGGTISIPSTLLQASISQKLRRGDQIQDDILMMRANGACWFSCDATPVTLDGKLQYVIVVMHDISHKKMIEAEMEAAARMKNESDFKDAIDTMTIVMSSSQLLLNLVNNVLDLQKIDAGKMDFNRSPMEVSCCLVRAVRACQHIANQKEVTLIIFYAGRLLTIADNGPSEETTFSASPTGRKHGDSGRNSTTSQKSSPGVQNGYAIGHQDSDRRFASMDYFPNIFSVDPNVSHDHWYKVLPTGMRVEAPPDGFPTRHENGSGEFRDQRRRSSVETASLFRQFHRRMSLPANSLGGHGANGAGGAAKGASKWVKRMYDDCGDINIVVESMEVAKLIGAANAPTAEEEDMEFRDMPDLIVSDAAKLTQCCINLIGNAIKFSPAGSVVKLEVRAVRSAQDPFKQHLLFSVCDQGAGIAIREQGKLFKKFSQINPASKEAARGSGLGLSICKNLLDLLEGGIWYGDGQVDVSTSTEIDSRSDAAKGRQSEEREHLEVACAGISTVQTPLSVARDIAALRRLHLPVPSEALEELEAAVKALNTPSQISETEEHADGAAPSSTDITRNPAPPLRGCFGGARFHFRIPMVRPVASAQDVTASTSTPNTAASLQSSSVHGSMTRLNHPLPNAIAMLSSSTVSAALQTQHHQLQLLNDLASIANSTSPGLSASITHLPTLPGSVPPAPQPQQQQSGPPPPVHPATSSLASAAGAAAHHPARGSVGGRDHVAAGGAATNSGTGSGPSADQDGSPRRQAGQAMTVSVPGSATQSEVGPQFAVLRKVVRSDLSKISMLVVDDDPINKKVLCKILKDLCAKVFHLDLDHATASNGLEALEAMKRQRFDVVFMDVMMPVMDGLEAVRHAVQLWPDPRERPVILSLTANAMQIDIDAAIEAGADCHVTKPVTLGKIKTLLCHLGLEPCQLAPAAGGTSAAAAVTADASTRKE